MITPGLIRIWKNGLVLFPAIGSAPSLTASCNLSKIQVSVFLPLFKHCILNSFLVDSTRSVAVSRHVRKMEVLQEACRFCIWISWKMSMQFWKEISTDILHRYMWSNTHVISCRVPSSGINSSKLNHKEEFLYFKAGMLISREKRAGKVLIEVYVVKWS